MKKQNILSICGLTLMAGLLFSGCLKDYNNPASGTPGQNISIFALRQAYQGKETTLNAANLNGATRIEGVVISDKTGMNIDPNSFVMQQTIPSSNAITDVTRGIIIRTTAAPTVNIGDSIQVIVTGATINRINGNITVSGIGADKISQIATGKTPLSRAVTQGMLHARMDEYESTLVTLNAEFAGGSAGGTLAGQKALNDNTGDVVYSYTLSTAPFSSTTLSTGAQIGGVAGFYNETGTDSAGAKKVIMPRNAGDIQFPSGALYAGFPEKFESPDATAKSSYNSGTNIIALSTGNWYLLQAILGNTPAADRFNNPGKQSIRMQQNLTTSGYVQMNFDVTEGASKVTVFYGRYSTDAKSSFRLESSVNGGTTWVAVGNNVSNEADKLMKQAVFAVNFTGTVRFRINKLGTGTTNNGRLNIDDFAIYKK